MKFIESDFTVEERKDLLVNYQYYFNNKEEAKELFKKDWESIRKYISEIWEIVDYRYKKSWKTKKNIFITLIIMKKQKFILRQFGKKLLKKLLS